MRRPEAPRFRGLFVGGAALALLAILPGCFRLRVQLRLQKDGSGTQQVAWRLPAATLGRLERAAQAVVDESGERFDPRKVFDRRAVATEIAAAGLQLLDHSTALSASGPGGRDAAITASFADFATLEKSPLLGTKVEWYVLAGRNPGNLRLVCYLLGSEAWRQTAERLRQLGSAPTDMQHQYFDGQRQRLAGLDLQFDLTLPGAVDYTSPNLETLPDGHTVRLRLRATDLRSAEDVVRALAPRFEVEFDGDGVLLPLVDVDPGMVEQTPLARPPVTGGR